jgi:hypothetical protein
LSEDWIHRFFRYAEDISNEEMQALWGKILAGEVKHPKTYSLRTLELVKNLTQEEGALFQRIANFAIHTENATFLFDKDWDLLESKYGIEFNDISKMIEAGIIHSDIHAEYRLHQVDQPVCNSFKVGEYLIMVEKKAFVPEINLRVRLFTRSGSELLKLIKSNPPLDYILDFTKACKMQDVKVKYKNLGADIEEVL